MSTPQRRHIKVLKTHYGKPDGWDYNNGIVAFGKTEDIRGTKGVKGKRKRIKL